VIHKTKQEKPFNATHWSTRTMAARDGAERIHGTAHLAGQWPEAAAGEDLQGQQRYPVRGKTGGRGGPLSQPAGACHCFVRR